ncbi:MAG: hypothetical protein LLG04_04930 [Parachlamydia sp.]|nr:hypothetical protein [Parachlamydia sp.]
MSIIQRCTHLSLIKAEIVKQCQQSRWYHLSRTYIVQADSQYTALSLNCLQRLEAAFLRIFSVNYFARVLKTKVKLLDNKAIAAALDKQDKVDRALDHAVAKATEAKKMNKKLGLFLCRGAEQSVPANGDEIWITLDLTQGKPLDPARVHLQMDANDKRLERIYHLFDKVILDFSCWGIVGDNEPWKKLRNLLKNSPEAELITEMNGNGSNWRQYDSEEEIQRNPIDLDACARHGGMIVPWIPAWGSQTRRVRQHEVVLQIKDKIEEYLKTLFHTVIRERNKPFPCTSVICDYLVMRGPKA